MGVTFHGIISIVGVGDEHAGKQGFLTARAPDNHEKEYKEISSCISLGPSHLCNAPVSMG